MSKGQRGNKEAKKPKKAPVDKPLAPPGEMAPLAVAPRPRFLKK
ncbi:hypothetical protein [Pseudaquabacterium terrae]|nr:hypothetical protein [Aquabacterium terrae]